MWALRRCCLLAGTLCIGGNSFRAPSSTNPVQLFRACSEFLEEGSLETRTYGKRLVWAVKGLVGGRPAIDRLTAGLPSERLRRNVADALEGSNGPPLPPSRISTLRSGRHTRSGGASGGQHGYQCVCRLVHACVLLCRSCWQEPSAGGTVLLFVYVCAVGFLVEPWCWVSVLALPVCLDYPPPELTSSC